MENLQKNLLEDERIQKTAAEKSAEEIARNDLIAFCKAFKEMTLARIKFLTGHSSMYTPDEIRAVRECFETIMELRI